MVLRQDSTKGRERGGETRPECGARVSGARGGESSAAFPPSQTLQDGTHGTQSKRKKRHCVNLGIESVTVRCKASLWRARV